ncbi:unnamed protein product [Aureobasidium vineae]|uniref:Uncharacterized protein n=1 Tax=Aureobasidium vineae TaxID=2773715 RepID=A0A9N8JDX7_9PEZI|nr:unnamed protein product [Aureobasidium vineae]
MGTAAFNQLRSRKPRSWAIALKYFEDYVKKNFDPMDSQAEYDDNKFNVPLPGAEDDISAGIDCGFITLSTAEVGELCRPLVSSVIDLVERQRNVLAAYGKTAKGVVPVGGFGTSNFLYKCLKSRFADEDPHLSTRRQLMSPCQTQRQALSSYSPSMPGLLLSEVQSCLACSESLF